MRMEQGITLLVTMAFCGAVIAWYIANAVTGEDGIVGLLGLKPVDGAGSGDGDGRQGSGAKPHGMPTAGPSAALVDRRREAQRLKVEARGFHGVGRVALRRQDGQPFAGTPETKSFRKRGDKRFRRREGHGSSSFTKTPSELSTRSRGGASRWIRSNRDAGQTALGTQKPTKPNTSAAAIRERVDQPAPDGRAERKPRFKPRQ